MVYGIQNKIALITAASQGIGKAVACALMAEGCIAAICSRSKAKLEESSAEIKNKFGREPFWFVCDLNNPKEIESAAKVTVEKLGPIEILVNNCGGPVPGYFNELQESDWENAYNQVLMSAVRFSRLVLPSMIKNKWGRIINIASVSVKQPVEKLMLSNSLRGGLIGFAKTLSNEVAKHNITVNNIAPGMTLTHRLYELAVVRAKDSGKSHEEILVELAKQNPMNRLGTPEEIAALAAFLASQQASYLTGTTIQVDGGATKALF